MRDFLDLIRRRDKQAQEVGRHLSKTFPHEISCPDCLKENLCNYCATAASRRHRCTNGRCAACCRDHCRHSSYAELGE